MDETTSWSHWTAKKRAQHKRARLASEILGKDSPGSEKARRILSQAAMQRIERNLLAGRYEGLQATADMAVLLRRLLELEGVTTS